MLFENAANISRDQSEESKHSASFRQALPNGPENFGSPDIDKHERIPTPEADAANSAMSSEAPAQNISPGASTTSTELNCCVLGPRNATVLDGSHASRFRYEDSIAQAHRGSPATNKEFRSMYEVELFLAALKEFDGNEEKAWKNFKAYA